MDAREQALRDWATGILARETTALHWQVVAGDASTRRYFRLRDAGESWICVDAPPATEKNPEFLRARSILADAGVVVPELLAAAAEQGFLLLGDLGERTLLPLLDRKSVDAYYATALDTLFTMQQIPAPGLTLPGYSAEVLREELQRFPQWFCRELLGLDNRAEDAQLLQRFEEQLIEAALAQPRVFVHRDFHSRNLLLQADGSLGVIDFQDALVGPLCYDLVSLLRDCYIYWPGQQVRDWALAYQQRVQQAGLCPAVEAGEFLRWFDWIGLQRHLKVLGNFARLAVRDGRPQYLQDLPLVLRYIHDVLDEYAAFADVKDWFATELNPRIETQSWSVPSGSCRS